MNVIFHFAAALGTALMVWLLLRAQQQRDLLRRLLLRAAAPGGSQVRLTVDAPSNYLAQICRALNLDFESDGHAGAPVRLNPAPLAELLFQVEIGLVRCSKLQSKEDAADLLVELHVVAKPAAPVLAGDWTGRLAAALGGNVRVALVEPART